MTVLAFTVTFHGPFRVGAAYAKDGVNAALDHDDPLPADHLKGVMRAAAAQLLGGRGHPAISAVFGSPKAPSAWSWSHADAEWDFSRRHRVKIDAMSHSAVKDHLVVAEQAWAPEARFTVTKAGLIAPDGGITEAAHVSLLRCAAAGVHGLGGWRRRGLGWVGIAPQDGPVTAGDIEVIQGLTREAEGARQ
ncbi:MAG: hypothetical protein ACRDOI_32835 [Trebonia sp.]